MYTTENFSENLIKSVIAYMSENKVKVFPLEFLVTRNDYHSCEFARKFWAHGYRYFTINGSNELVLHGVWDHLGEKFVGKTFDWIITSKHYGYEPTTIHHCMATEDLLALVQIAYDTIGSTHFTGRGVESFNIDELKSVYETWRNEI